VNLKEMKHKAVCEAVLISGCVGVLYENSSSGNKQLDNFPASFSSIAMKVKRDLSLEETSDLLWGPMLSTLRRR
jgi:hypothetical protein